MLIVDLIVLLGRLLGTIRSLIRARQPLHGHASSAGVGAPDPPAPPDCPHSPQSHLLAAEGSHCSDEVMQASMATAKLHAGKVVPANEVPSSVVPSSAVTSSLVMSSAVTSSVVMSSVVPVIVVPSSV